MTILECRFWSESGSMSACRHAGSGRRYSRADGSLQRRYKEFFMWLLDEPLLGKFVMCGALKAISPMRKEILAEAVEPAALHSLEELASAEAACRRCPLYSNATQAVPGEGSPGARFMLVGEQPGDKEDLAGKPFVGPAGRVLDQALAEAGIARADAFVTNAVKHFKHELRGKRRLHKKPNAHEIERCKIWLEVERGLVKPSVTIALGATAARSLFGRPVTIGSMRGRALQLADGASAVVTIHPSFLLRIQDDGDKRREYGRFVSDLKVAVAALSRR
ncbi:MAG: UdgX family uracil-DNA binding protein [Hyphomicrobiales bacterium]|nr:UdgX family uracil-DNA binding protein [Hyphomicrobiales bacterium]